MDLLLLFLMIKSTQHLSALETKYYLLSLSNFAAASRVDTDLLMKNVLTIPQAISQKTNMAKIVVHSNILLSTFEAWNKNRNIKSASMRPRIYQTTWVPRYNGLVVRELYESISLSFLFYSNSIMIEALAKLVLHRY